ncbi:MAG: quinolinate synthase NadA [Chloroflexi bacterium AL-W]|nr:quinolinate synthase NadA [Chloroflexi bacterium AL-N1]NOK70286.1 quinolinate synthase NadA [Chloroflexi bacterium AL-N10]NOK77823.1 quinolinate synthase NadA [Chloroflexi bacterium AL-N5]NOK84832.1 quinolinate synthase NadA [Chloroflexi bacterium AL-W]NOK92439.1 quinolinate synthase NadA [Chloroflexi bacterium AL-N15]
MTTIAMSPAQEQTAEIVDMIQQRKRERNAVILAHNYQYGEIQDLADFVGDSLGLSQVAARTDADVIVFCGVHFMAETAAILCPDKTVLLPDLEAGCSLASSITADQLRDWKTEHPGAVVVSYVNTTAEVKAESDYCCTSGNALRVIQAIPEDREILFLPDMFLGSYLRKVTGRPMHIWAGECHVHAAIKPAMVNGMREANPDAEFLIHPECGCVSSTMHYLERGLIDKENTHILSTEGMINHTEKSSSSQFIVATEIGVLHRMQKANPDKQFLPIDESISCRYMKMITLDKVLRSLQENVHHVTVPQEVAERARGSIDRMVSL